MEKFQENEAAVEMNCQLNSRKSHNFPRKALIASTFLQFWFRVQLFLDNHLPYFVTGDSCLFHFIGKCNEKREIPWWNSNIYLHDAKRNLDLKKKSHSWYFDQKMCLKELAVAVSMVRGISLRKDFCFY